MKIKLGNYAISYQISSFNGKNQCLCKDALYKEHQFTTSCSPNSMHADSEVNLPQFNEACP